MVATLAADVAFALRRARPMPSLQRRRGIEVDRSDRVLVHVGEDHDVDRRHVSDELLKVGERKDVHTVRRWAVNRIEVEQGK